MILSWFKKYLPTKKQIENNKSLSFMSKWLKARPYLWLWHKQTVAGGVGVSLLVAFIPLPIQMAAAAFLAALFRVNLPVAVLGTWISNPVTFVPANYLIYKTGQWILGVNNSQLPQMNWHDLTESSTASLIWLGAFGKAYLIGFPVVSFLAAIIGYVLVYGIWTIYEKCAFKKDS